MRSVTTMRTAKVGYIIMSALFCVIGLVLMLAPKTAFTWLGRLLGIPVLADGLFKIQIALDSRRLGIRRWWLILILAVLTCAVGIVLVFRPAVGILAMTVFMGVSLLLDGILNLCVALFTVKIVANQKPDVIEVETFEIDH